MKMIKIFLLAYLFIYSYQDCSKSDAKKEDCKNDNLSTDEKEAGEEYCCFVENGNSKRCNGYTKYQYEHIGDLIKLSRLQGADDKLSIDCNSLNLKISISILSLLFLLI